MTGALRRPAVGALIFPGVLLVGIVAGLLADGGNTPLGVWVFLTVIAGWVVSLCLHEFAHSVVALAGGDTSVRARGYLTLNPLRYTDPVFSLIIPLVLLAVGGIPLPGGAVLIESHRLRSRAWSSLVSAAGPLTNFVLGVICTLAAGSMVGSNSFTGLAAALSFLAVLQFVTAILNVLPIPGFDGFGILSPYLSPQFNRRIAPIRPWAPLILFALIWTVPQISAALFSPAFGLFELFGGDEYAAAVGQSLFQFWRF
ncbi:site-2 protease family protein [Nakamurella sp. YIM 132087]|uniref:Site-2 protease family protein n=1 Tax=Nakamurella alba TaxID=2665158 RepID=A0A7K1FL47_9ACTN|nr:site-2 protease family protein [Nakamurella alba]MTD14099.1 site-2 protease family protein [Nakamurella alba]